MSSLHVYISNSPYIKGKILKEKHWTFLRYFFSTTSWNLVTADVHFEQVILILFAVSLAGVNSTSQVFRVFRLTWDGYYSISLRSLYLWCDMSTKFIFKTSYLAALPWNIEIFCKTLYTISSRINILFFGEKIAGSGGKFCWICRLIAP
jgi:hypothetical protein